LRAVSQLASIPERGSAALEIEVNARANLEGIESDCAQLSAIAAMSTPNEHEDELHRFPDVLRELVTAELSLGNEIAELGHGFPAAPCGAYIKLAQPVSSRPREKTPELDFYERNGGSHSGEFTDATRHFFVLEPPHPPEANPDMDAIRAKLNSKDLASECAGRESTEQTSAISRVQPDHSASTSSDEHSDSLVARFRASMKIDFDKWHDGTGYDIGLFEQASPDELKEIENILLPRCGDDWRSVEALAALDSDRANEALRQTLSTADASVRMAIHRYAPTLPSHAQRIATLVQVLERASLHENLSAALDEVADFHPPEIVAALMRGLMAHDGSVACHFAAMLCFVHGKAASAFDWDQRPFFLRFNTDNLVEREVAARELFATLGVDPGPYIKPA
jgi:hypothetical protein